MAVADARAYADAGLHAVIVENMHDRPYLRGAAGPEIVAAMTMAVAGVRSAVGVPLGVQILAAADRQAVAVAHAAGASFVRVECFAFAHVGDEGIHQSNAGDLLRYRKAIGADGVRVLADVKKKHSAHALTADVGHRGSRARGGVLPGRRRDRHRRRHRPARRSPEEVASVKVAVGIPVLVGSGITAENLGRYAAADAFIVGTSLKRDGDWTQAVDPLRARALVAARERLRRLAARVTPDLVVLGNLLVDDIVFADGRTRMGEAGGATLYARGHGRALGRAGRDRLAAGARVPAGGPRRARRARRRSRGRDGPAARPAHVAPLRGPRGAAWCTTSTRPPTRRRRRCPTASPPPGVAPAPSTWRRCRCRCSTTSSPA